MKKYILLLCAVGLTLHARADIATTGLSALADSEDLLRPLTPTYRTDAVQASGLFDHWFLALSGGGSAFVGSPMGCNDLWGRIEPSFSGQVGKWFTPHVGARVAYQGHWFRDCENLRQTYHYAHADLLWNLMGSRYNARDRPFSLIPYAGLGLLRHRGLGSSSFALSYGLTGRYRLTQRMHLTMELGGATTFSDFDGHGDSRELGDHLLSASAGVSVTVGRAAWRPLVDARPYMHRTEQLQARVAALTADNRSLSGRLQAGERANVELKKILEIEGLLQKYQAQIAESTDAPDFSTATARNDYSGLRSLMRRMEQSHIGNGMPYSGEYSHEITGTQSPCTMCVGAPIYLFFRLGTARLTDESQQVNIDALARVAVQYGLNVQVIGAADSATGNPDINARLSQDRAQYISAQLQGRGVAPECITIISEGGIDAYAPAEANRNTRIELHTTDFN
jgi:outer membrane protein OmpA-like peptidoglycan-associated protein